MRSFRLFSAQVDPVGEYKDAFQVEFSPDITVNNSGNWFTVIIGKNGTGKSRLLAGLANAFCKTTPGGRNQISHGYNISNIIFGDAFGKKIFKKNNWGIEKYVLPNLPTKIIASTMTPFDKFALTKIDYLENFAKHQIDNKYSYLGLRDRTGRASPAAALNKAISALFGVDTSNKIKSARLAKVFEYLGYMPRVRVKYRLTHEFLQILHDGHMDNFLERAAPRIQRIANQLLQDTDLMRDVFNAIIKISRRAEGDFIFLEADFLQEYSDHGLFPLVQLLQKVELARLMAVNVIKQDSGEVIDLKSASSGEIGIVTTFLGIASVIEDGSLILIDEPEISLHPEWQENYINMLENTFSGFSGCHFILATHSPLIVSNISAENSSVIDISNNKAKNYTAYDLAGKSADYLLMKVFDTPGNNNLSLKQDIVRALRLLADGKVKSKEFMNVVQEFQEVLPHIDQNSPDAKIITEIIGSASKEQKK